jgi:hypothetical protein
LNHYCKICDAKKHKKSNSLPAFSIAKCIKAKLPEPDDLVFIKTFLINCRPRDVTRERNYGSPRKGSKACCFPGILGGERSACVSTLEIGQNRVAG